MATPVIQQPPAPRSSIKHGPVRRAVSFRNTLAAVSASDSAEVGPTDCEAQSLPRGSTIKAQSSVNAAARRRSTLMEFGKAPFHTEKVSEGRLCAGTRTGWVAANHVTINVMLVLMTIMANLVYINQPHSFGIGRRASRKFEGRFPLSPPLAYSHSRRERSQRHPVPS